MSRTTINEILRRLALQQSAFFPSEKKTSVFLGQVTIEERVESLDLTGRAEGEWSRRW